VAIAFLQGYGIFFLLAAPWMYLISEKEKRFTISTAGSQAMNLINPEINPDPFDNIHYPFEKGILTPPPPHAISAWLYQHRLTETKWSPFHSAAGFLHYMKMISRNILSVGSFHFGRDAGTVLVLVLLLLFILRRADLKTLFKENAILLIACLTCTVLYSLLITIHRYLWINDIAIVILFSGAAQKLFFWKRWAGVAALGIFIFILFYAPVKSIAENINADKNIYAASHFLKDKYAFGGNVGSLTGEHADNNHRLSHLVCYYTGSLYYGMAGEHNIKDIEKQRIDYVLDWNHSVNSWLTKNKLSESAFTFSEPDLTVYKIKHSFLQKD
jgi:hypothetical protein